VAKNKTLLFSRPMDGMLSVQPEAIATIVRYSKPDGEHSEAGGVLLGRLILESRDVAIDRVTEPFEADKRSKFHFWRSRMPHQNIVDQAWKNSTGTCIYLGEWHCHPEDDPHPSKHDLENWAKIARTASYEQDFLFFVIAGYTRIRAWELNKARIKPTELLESECGR